MIREEEKGQWRNWMWKFVFIDQPPYEAAASQVTYRDAKNKIILSH
jgi:hypothetical protein